jgi:hypothetical protein
MDRQERKKLNQRVGALAFGRLKLDEETYRMIVSSIDEQSEGHLTRCNDENANLVLLALERMVSGGAIGATSVTLKNQRQQKFIARLMDYLGWTWKDTARFCLHQTGKRSTKDCNAGELSKVIIGLIRIIDDRIAKGLLKLSPDQSDGYHRHTKLERQKDESSTPTGERSAA